MTSPEVLISLTERFAGAFRSGLKSVEVRRRRLNVPPNTRIWMYTKLPRGRVELVGRIVEVVAASPSKLWSQYGPQTGLTRQEFFEYLNGCDIAYAMPIANIRALSPEPTLIELRRNKRGFQPPQFATLIKNGGALHRVLSSAAAT